MAFKLSSLALALIAFCAIIAGSYAAGALSQTHITVVIERTPFEVTNEATEAFKHALPPRKPSH